MPASPWTIDVRDLARRQGETRTFETTVALPDAIGNAVIGIPAGGELDIAGRFESLHDGILVSAEITGMTEGECVRCLIAVAQPLQVDFQELFAYDGTSDFDYRTEGDSLDLEQVVRDTVVPALPFQPVCQEDCEGLCPICGVRLLDFPGHEHEAQIDPRWAALNALQDGGPTAESDKQTSSE